MVVEKFLKANEMVNMELVGTKEDVLENSDKSSKSINIFDEKLVAITSRRGHFYWDTSTIVVACILDLANFHMNEFHYKVSIACQSGTSTPETKTKKRAYFAHM